MNNTSLESLYFCSVYWFLVFVGIALCEEVDDQISNTVSRSLMDIPKRDGYSYITGIGEEVQVTDEHVKYFFENMNSEEFFVVKFYAPWCPFSTQLQPTYLALARAFPSLPVLSIDASKFTSLNYRFGIYSFPKIVLFSGNESIGVKKYHGNRELHDISNWLTKSINLQPVAVVENFGEDSTVIYIDYCYYFCCLFLIAISIYNAGVL